MIEIDHVTYTYPGATRPAVQDLSLTIADGEFLLVCGPSGAGKSTFLRLINGLVPHFHGGTISGSVQVWGRSTLTNQPRDLADLVGFVFQDPEAQFVVDAVEDEIVFAMENLGLAQAIMRRRVEEVLDQLGIAHLRARKVSSLSGGEQQRVAIAAVLAAQPRALVLDEPTSQLDPHAAEEVLTALQKLNADLGLTVILSEHRLERVIQYADRVLFLPSINPVDTESYQPILGSPREALAQTHLAPPLITLGKRLGWEPLPLTIKEARRFAPISRQTPITQPPEPRPNTRPAVIIEGVHFNYGTREALYDLSLTARPGEVLALMGRNGSGKTTLLKLIAGLLRPQRGRVTVMETDVTRRSIEQLAAFIGYVPQDPRTLLFHDTLREELDFTLRERNKRAGTPGQVATLLEGFGLLHLAETYPRDLSGGEAQRAALATVLAGDPPVLLLDEPTRGLDYAAKTNLTRQLRELVSQQKTIIMSTHDVELVAACADRVALLGEGELIVEGPVREVLSDSLIFSPQIAKLFPHSGWLTADDVPAPELKEQL